MDIIKDLQYVAFELSHICPLREEHCQCPIRHLDSNNKIMPTNIIFTTLEKLRKYNPNPTIYFHIYNEPSIDCRLLYIIHHIRKHMDIKWRISIHTNGYSFDENVIKEFSEEGINEIVTTIRKKEEFEFWTTVKNKAQTPNVGIKLITQFFDLRLKLYGELGPEITHRRVNEIYDDKDEIIIKQWQGDEKFYCNFINCWLGIDPDGDVMLCEYDWKRTKKFGNIVTDDIEEIFNKKNNHSDDVNSNREKYIPCNICPFTREKKNLRAKDFKVMSALKNYMEDTEGGSAEG